MTTEELKNGGEIATSGADVPDTLWQADFVSPEDWDDYRIALERRYCMATGENASLWVSFKPLNGNNGNLATPIDLVSVEEIESALDEAEVPTIDTASKELSLVERVRLLAEELADVRAQLPEEGEMSYEEALGLIEELRSEAGVVSEEFERDLWRASRRILDRLGFNWKDVDYSGVTADDVEDFVMDAITALERKARRPKKPLPASVTAEDEVVVAQ